MKNETARREIESLDYYLQNHTDDYSEESHTAMMMAIKALEQEPCEDATLKDIFCMGCEYKEREPILDKIKAEIKQLPYQRIFGNVSSYSLLDTVVEIIDKYKAESEG